PACIDGVIAVGAVGEDGHPSPFTTTGDHVTLSAPGERVKSAGLSGYQRVTGTSFASPFVAAAAALLVSRAGRRSAPLGGRDALRILRDSARPFPGASMKGHGTGILDVVAALRMLDREIDAGRRRKADPSLRS
ncbi:MAG TPA: S8 family serine peptidase, partial [Gemmatimonadaceae bacterium]